MGGHVAPVSILFFILCSFWKSCIISAAGADIFAVVSHDFISCQRLFTRTSCVVRRITWKMCQPDDGTDSLLCPASFLCLVVCRLTCGKLLTVRGRETGG
ncbi:hypothetical protein L228DRAFT_47880 [Xylona heveae TC161]|uniref:Secreted protein n=1 Tax=Xylona heveae (strain CBS 132557 / TC161) TaxID=1328760 RepID=A0A164ZJU0_XYLHT|nr:hypothetical protein L228DRAFT_47880 [Xylona heveae TC161]KZF19185.1 hypothetical protein L228DRAFT_47880 [Xylona heveae TC161]